MPIDRTHENIKTEPSKKEVRKVKFAPLMNRKFPNMTYGKIYEVLEERKDNDSKFANPFSWLDRFVIENDIGEKLVMSQELFDDLPLYPMEPEPSEAVFEKGCLPVAFIDTSIETLREKYRNISDIELNGDELRLADVKEQKVKTEKSSCDCCKENKAVWVDRKIFADPSKEVLSGDTLQDIWESVSKEFPSKYLPQVIDSSVLGYLKKNMGFEFAMGTAGDNAFLAVNGIPTKFTVDSITTAQEALSNIVGYKKSCKIVARAIQSQLEIIF